MNKQKRDWANNTNVEISRLEKAKLRDSETIKTLSKSLLDKQFINSKIEELNKALNEKDEKIFLLKEKMNSVLNNEKDNDLEISLEIQRKKIVEEKKKIERKKEEKKKEEKKNNDLQFEKYKEKSEEYQKRNDYRYFFRKFNEANETLPFYMKKNLKEMSENMGYIWRGCWFFGYLPADREKTETIMFEKSRNGILKIHEYSQSEYRLYEKQGKERKKLIFSKPRRLVKQFRLGGCRNHIK